MPMFLNSMQYYISDCFKLSAIFKCIFHGLCFDYEKIIMTICLILIIIFWVKNCSVFLFFISVITKKCLASIFPLNFSIRYHSSFGFSVWNFISLQKCYWLESMICHRAVVMSIIMNVFCTVRFLLNLSIAIKCDW